MDEHTEQLPTDEGLPLLPSEEQDLTADGQEHGPEVDDQARLSRREFMKAAALSAGSLLLLLSRCRPLVEFKSAELPPIPENFRRFYLAEKSTTIAGEMRVLALGSQCPDLTCALWWARDKRFEFFERVEQIQARYTADGRTELLWLD
ncbi:MAG: twin-arginine translocation signal domain-containing protein [Candidatus Promineifilaceae bacterium]